MRFPSRGVWGRALAGLLSLLLLGAWLGRLAHTGLSLEVRAEDGRIFRAYPRADLGTSRTDSWLSRGSGPLRASWTGYWVVPNPGFGELVLKSDGEALVYLDGALVLSTGGDTPNRSISFVPPGPHQLRVTYSPGEGAKHEVFLKGVTPDHRSIDLQRGATFATRPGWRDAVLDTLAVRILPVLTILAWLWALVGRRDSEPAFSLKKQGPIALVCLALIVAGGLRFEALVTRYWGIEAPDVAEALAAEIHSLRPGSFEHSPNPHPYEGDPFSYLTIARSMGSFYEPSAREPLFPSLTRAALFLASGKDIGINFLSASCSALCCLALFALGRSLGSPWGGALAALLWAVEWQSLSFSVEGWRDDLFCLQVTLCVAGLVSLHLKPERREATLLGLLAGLTLLTRLSALTFLIPSLIAAVILPGSASRRERFEAAGVVVFWMLLLAGPFMAACAIGYGDPFYAVNVHAGFYRRRAGLGAMGGDNALRFLMQSRLPWEFVEIGFIGLTTYPFLNKWAGLSGLLPGLGDLVRPLALLGLPVLLWRPGGVLCLVAFVLSIVPYAWTWDIPGGSEWRFTLPIYTLFLLSAAMAFEAMLCALGDLPVPDRRKGAWRSALRVTATGILLAVSGLWAIRALDWLRVEEAARNGRPALIEAGPRASRFFQAGWSFVKGSDGSEAMEMNGPRARLRLPAAAGHRLRVVLRVGANERPPSSVSVLQGTKRLAILTGRWGPGQTVAFDLGDGSAALDTVDLDLLAEGAENASPLALLWVRVEPSIPKTQAGTIAVHGSQFLLYSRP